MDLFCITLTINILSLSFSYKLYALGPTKYMIMYRLDQHAVYVVTSVLFHFYFQGCQVTREINTKITLDWAYKPFVSTIIHYLISCTTRWVHTWRYKNVSSTSCAHCSPSFSIFNRLDIDFIHGHIYGRSCKVLICRDITCRANFSPHWHKSYAISFLHVIIMNLST